MATLAFLALVLFAGWSPGVQSSFLSTKIQTTIEEYPSVVQIDFRGVFSGIWGQSCAGHILNNNYILSAAQCFHGLNYDAQYRRIRAGSTYRETSGVLAYVEIEFNHPSYGLRGYDGDISVVKLKDKLVYGTGIAPGAIVIEGHEHPDSMPVVHIGWGPSSLRGSASSELLRTTSYTINIAECRFLYMQLSIPEIVTENMICARRHEDDIASICQGDTGGPLYHVNEDSSTILLGIVSWDHGCSGPEFPGVSTRIASYTKWIVETVV